MAYDWFFSPVYSNREKVLSIRLILSNKLLVRFFFFCVPSFPVEFFFLHLLLSFDWLGSNAREMGNTHRFFSFGHMMKKISFKVFPSVQYRFQKNGFFLIHHFAGPLQWHLCYLSNRIKHQKPKWLLAFRLFYVCVQHTVLLHTYIFIAFVQMEQRNYLYTRDFQA